MGEFEYPYAKKTGVFADYDRNVWKSRFKPGETVYLKEPYFVDVLDGCHYKYKKFDRDDRFSEDEHKWTNKLFMPEKYARYHIEITGIKVERLQDISDEDCLKEGVKQKGYYGDMAYYNLMPVIIKGVEFLEPFDTPREAYAALIDAIHGKGAWESNPYIWVYNFKLNK
jgi:hypothetical protein